MAVPLQIVAQRSAGLKKHISAVRDLAAKFREFTYVVRALHDRPGQSLTRNNLQSASAATASAIWAGEYGFKLELCNASRHPRISKSKM